MGVNWINLCKDIILMGLQRAACETELGMRTGGTNSAAVEEGYDVSWERTSAARTDLKISFERHTICYHILHKK